MTEEETVCEYIRMSLGVILWLCSFCKNSIWFYSRSVAYLTQVLDHLSDVGDVFQFISWTLNLFRQQLLLSQALYHFALVQLTGMSLVQIKGFVAGLVFTFLSQQHTEYLPEPQTLSVEVKSLGSYQFDFSMFNVFCWWCLSLMVLAL